MSDNTEKIRYLKSLQIKNLWDEINIEWALDPKVNILIGKNGTGKTTLLQLIDSIVDERKFYDGDKFGNLYLKFNNERYVVAEKINKKDIDAKEKRKSYRFLLRSNSEFSYTINTDFLSREQRKYGERLREFINICRIDTFDLHFSELDERSHYEGSEIKTSLDILLKELIDDFKSYQLKLRNSEKKATYRLDEKIKELSFKESANKHELQELQSLIANKDKEIEKIYQQQENFIGVVNRLFSDTGKTIDFDKNNAIVFNKKNKIITAYQLSSGEKQLLIILLTVIQQENQPSIILMDEPELSLHLSWQMELINIIQMLNPNSQLIIATHSPSVFMKGWNDKITRMEDISTPVSAS